MKAIDLANYIINRCINNETYISNLQLQKILYFINLLYLGKNEAFLIEKNDNFEAWMHGPVIYDVYKEFANYGGTKIYDEQKKINEDTFIDEKGDKVERDNIDKINEAIDYLARVNPWKLVEYSHAETGAWFNTYDSSKSRPIINKELIKKEAGI